MIGRLALCQALVKAGLHYMAVKQASGAYHAECIIGSIATIGLSKPDDLVGHVAADSLQSQP